jgi:hypothetical protein
MEVHPVKPLLSSFLENLETVPKELIEALLHVSCDEDEKNVIHAITPAFVNQFKELSNFISEQACKCSKQSAANVEQFLKISSAKMLLEDLKIALPSIGSIVGKLGIDGIIKEIKKVIKEILKLFGVSLPDWIDTLVNLIDEIIATIFGVTSAKLRITLSQIEQHYLAELTQLAKLQKATRALSTSEEDED